MTPPPISEQISELIRELNMRRKVYPRWVRTGKMTQTVADRQMHRMEAALQTLKQVQHERVNQSGLFT